ncbi:sensor histidine kinase [Paenibacillus sp. S150]|uniref:sensor histidine kinase n=1 Tax=Paenibacillus sp. S150 TaxID=2749826 RepID=UPI001C59478D|nr:sensor histidine kinase [Paenibacillus sp. S150]MBW4084409.1 GHKL domain-containing protein [Paenibacillus sp. S150]
MKLPSTKAAAAILMLLLLIAVVSIGIAAQWTGGAGRSLPEWELKWEASDVCDPAAAAEAPDSNWVTTAAQSARPLTPAGTAAAWLRFSLPETGDYSALLIDKVYGHNFKAYMDNKLIYDSQDLFNHNGSKVLIPLPGAERPSQLYLWSSGGADGFGVEGRITAGSYGRLLEFYVKKDLADILIGAAFLFMGAALMVCLIFLKLDFFKGGFFLCLVIASFGVLLITYSPFLPLIVRSRGHWIEISFDLALFTLLPSFTFYFEQIFGSGKHGLITRLRKFQLAYSLFCLVFLIANALLSFRLDGLYRIATVDILGVLMMLQFIFLLYAAVRAAVNGNRDAVIFSIGFSVFALLSLTELIVYYADESYHLQWWKWGVIVFVVSLILILGRRFASNHEQAVEYSRELEKFNDDLQRSEKMEIISELAASVAHEVRNPLQVTRGFLQILGERSGKKEKEYLQMAMEELDRASLIITDFLTFAKPGMDTPDRFEVAEELRHVSGILVPLANMQGGTIELKLQSGLQVLGSTSKFKQAFINLIKNAIESLEEDGLITVAAWSSGQHVIISVQDNGEGMKMSELAHLGEPYYSNKKKGTGLGLMVTFRIIEAMNGSIHFHSRKGEGTEVIVKLPSSVNN